MRLFARAPAPVAAAREGFAVVRGEVLQVFGELPLPLALPSGAPPVDRIAALAIDVEHHPFLARPIRERYERARPFLLRDADGPGRALCRLAPRHRDDGRLAEDADLRLASPFVQSVEGEREVLVRAVAIGDTVVVAGPVHTEVDQRGAATYRDAPAMPVIEARALFDQPAWAQAEAWHALPWYRKLSLIVRNR